ncbi:MAG: low molecular weight protein-tyrosine-phosphatase [Phycisphaerales bacterium]|jgi:protein-tyrosine phosphatase|nr:low molecular weight protein-tyrosine-phosphatase [Phycisphaerales bacterium]
MSSNHPTSILFVCMGNICRSPAAECLTRIALERRGLQDAFILDSAGTGGWHQGNKPDRRMRKAAADVQKRIDGEARKVNKSDLETFDWIFCMDEDNYDHLLSLGANPEKTHLFLEFIDHPTTREVPDPYYGGDEGFAHVIALIEEGAQLLIDRLHKTL